MIIQICMKKLGWFYSKGGQLVESDPAHSMTISILTHSEVGEITSICKYMSYFKTNNVAYWFFQHDTMYIYIISIMLFSGFPRKKNVLH